MKKILVYDDKPDRCQEYIDKLRRVKPIKKIFKVDPMDIDDFKEEMTRLAERQQKLRKRKEGSYDMELDKTSIFIIDYDILHAFDKQSFLTGERVAYLIRCFSKCGLIIGYSAYEKNEFDLTLKGNLDSFADLDVAIEQLNNSGLWGEKTTKFRPWYWPHLPKYLDSFQKKVKDVIDNVNEPIWKVLKFPEEIVGTLPRFVSQFIGGDPFKTTFREFVVNSGNGLKGGDKNPNDELVGRIAAARISKLLEWGVLQRQDILIDTPHLVSRYPSLLKESRMNVKSWNKTAGFDTFEKLGIHHENIEKFRFEKEYWLSRPAWFWSNVSNSLRIPEVYEPWKKKPVPYVFCEDSSSFHKREKCKEFVADFDSPYVRRYVCKFKDISYGPKTRFSL